MKKENGLEYAVFYGENSDIPEEKSSQEYTAFDEFLEESVYEQLTKAAAEIAKEKSGRGCGCINCARMAVEKANNLIDFIADDDIQASHYRFYIIPTLGSFTIVQGIAARDQWRADHKESYG